MCIMSVSTPGRYHLRMYLLRALEKRLLSNSREYRTVRKIGGKVSAIGSHLISMRKTLEG